MSAAAEKLKLSLSENRAMHGYLITGGDPDSVEGLMRECAALLLFGNEEIDKLELSPDFFCFDGTIKVDEVRSIRREVNKTTYSSTNRAVLIKNAHLMNPSSINAMLKLLEEPPEGTYFFLSGNEYRILPTIISRVMVIRLGSGTEADTVAALISLGASTADAKRFCSEGAFSLEVAKKLYESEDFRKLREDSLSALISLFKGALPFAFTKRIDRNRANAAAAVEFMLGLCHDLIAIKSGTENEAVLTARERMDELREIALEMNYERIGAVVSRLVEAAERLTSNAGPGHILDRMILDINSAVTA